MARFPEQFIRQVAQATDVVELISQYVALKKSGKEFVGLCPFHEDHRPSMYVSPAKQIFKCFSCGAGGGVFQFLMLYEKQAFAEAVRALAERANIPLPKEAAAPVAAGTPDKPELLRALDFAARFFQAQLRSKTGSAALEYARGRGISEESIARFGLGFAPASWEALVSAARPKGCGEALLEAAGLAIRREGGGWYDRFRNRLMFPIFDPTGKIIAFGGRALEASEQAKYINSPDSPLFDKSSQLYALNWARESIVSSGQAIVVEGYLDALMPIQHGVANVVATLGTALTERHARLLMRYAQEIVLVFDADAAGTAATERALELFMAQQLHVRVATIPTGKDPCDFCLAEGGEAFRRLLADAPDAMQYVWKRRQEAWRAAGENLADRRRLVEDFLRLVASSAVYGAIDEVRRGQLGQHIAHMLNLSPADVQDQMRRLARNIPRSSQVRGPRGAAGAQPLDLAERELLEVLLNQPQLWDRTAKRIGPEDFAEGDLRRIAACVWRLGGEHRLNLDELLATEELAEHGSLVAELVTEGERRGNFEPTLEGALEHLLYRRQRRELEELKGGSMDDEALRKLGERLRKPDVRRRPGRD